MYKILQTFCMQLIIEDIDYDYDYLSLIALKQKENIEDNHYF